MNVACTREKKASDSHPGRTKRVRDQKGQRHLTFETQLSLLNACRVLTNDRSQILADSHPTAKNLAITHTDGTFIAGQQLSIDSAGLSGDGNLFSQGDLSVKLTQDFTHTGQLRQTTGDRPRFRFSFWKPGNRGLSPIINCRRTLFGEPYAAGSWQDKLVESFAGSHDFIGGKPLPILCSRT